MKSKSKYGSLAEWRKAEPLAYSAAKHNNWLLEIRLQFGWNLKIEWTKELCLNDAKKYKTRTSWNKLSYPAVYVAKKNGWYEECCVHMKIFSMPRGYWTKERCMEDALNYSSIKQWRNAKYSGYERALAQGWYDECISHMTNDKKRNGYWSKEKCIEDAKKYKTIKEWKKGSKGGAYIRALRNNWLDDCCSHMETFLKQKQAIKTHVNTYTKEVCMEEAKKYTRIKEWENNSRPTYSAAQRKGWLKECSAHMTKKEGRKPRNYWNEETIIESAKSFTQRKKWKKAYPTAYSLAYKLKIIDKCFSKQF